MTLRNRAWQLLCDLSRIRGFSGRDVCIGAYRMAEQITGRPWADCLTTEWTQIISRLGGGRVKRPTLRMSLQREPSAPGREGTADGPDGPGCLGRRTARVTGRRSGCPPA